MNKIGKLKGWVMAHSPTEKHEKRMATGKRKGNSEALKKAGKERELINENRLLEAIRRIETKKAIRVEAGATLTFSAVAKEAQLSRSTVYRHKTVKEKIEKKLTQQNSAQKPVERKTSDSQQNKIDELFAINNRLTIANDKLARENYRLDHENGELKKGLLKYEPDFTISLLKPVVPSVDHEIQGPGLGPEGEGGKA